MNNNEFLNELLNLEKLQVTDAEFAGAEQITLFVESTLAAAICPNCNQVSTKVHDLSAVQMIRDLSIGERRCYLSYWARRFDCEHCDKTFVERVDWKRPGVSYTLRYEKYIYQRARKEPVSQIAEDEGLSEEAGGLALLLSAYPNLSVDQQEQALINTAVDLGVSGPDDVYGYGRLDLQSALTWVSTAPTSTPVPTTTPTASPTFTPTPTDVPIVNLALNKPVTVSSYQDTAHSGSMAVDGNGTTIWQTKSVSGKNKLSSEWITVDLGSSQNINQAIIAWNTYFAKAYTVQVSSNNSSWSTVFSTSSGDGGNDTVSFNTVQARYVRLNATAWNNSTYHNWMKEFEIHAGTAADPSPTVTPTVTPTNTPTPMAANTMYVGDLDGSSVQSGSKWNASVTIMVHDSNENSLANAVVYGQWTKGATGNTTCTTDTNGICTASKTGISTKSTGVTFTVTNVTQAGLTYVSSANYDPDGDSNGTSIVVSKP
jgi:hypothetical protein